MDATSRKQISWGSVNFYLQKLGNLMNLFNFSSKKLFYWTDCPKVKVLFVRICYLNFMVLSVLKSRYMAHPSHSCSLFYPKLSKFGICGLRWTSLLGTFFYVWKFDEPRQVSYRKAMNKMLRRANVIWVNENR